jgi:Tol biopolymer transport system component
MLLIIVVMLSAVSLVAPHSPTPRELFERARIFEESNRNLDEAVALYGQVATQSTDRELAANAQLRAGLLHERLGRTPEARRVFQAVLARFPDVGDVARQAQAHLSAVVTRATPDPTVRLVWSGGDVDFLGAPSPDGRYISYADWNTGNLTVRDLSTGEDRHVTNKGGWTDSPEFVESSVFSPDGRQIAYAWFNGEIYELRTITVSGTERRTLSRNPEFTYQRPEQWSSDGRYILTTLWSTDRMARLALVSTADGSARVVKSLDWRGPRKAALSPDSRFIAYDFPAQDDAEARDVFVLTVDAGQLVRLTSHAANDTLLGWTPDGRRILFASDRTGSTSAWAVEILEGKPIGEPHLVKAGIGAAWPMGFTRSGAFYHGAESGSLDVYLAPFDPRASRLTGPPVRITERFLESSPSPAFSPDGRALAFGSQLVPGPAGTAPVVFAIRSLQSGDVRELPVDLTYVARLYWPAGGRWLVATGRDRRNRDGIFRVSLDTGATTTLVTGESDVQLRAPWLSPDGAVLFYLRGRQGWSGDTARIVRRDLATSEERELHRVEPTLSLRRMALSPDGRQITFITVDSRDGSSALQVMSAQGGDARRLVTVMPPDSITTGWDLLAWSSDGQRVFFGKDGGTPIRRRLWSVPAAGGDAGGVELPLESIGNVTFHPQGTQIAITSGTFKKEVWVLEHFLPPPARAQSNER